MSVFEEFRKRNVVRVGVAYLVTAWLIVQVAQTLFPLFGFGMAPARVVVILLAIGFVPALVLTWIFRITPAGIRREAEIEAAVPRASQLFDRIIIGILLLAVTVFAVDRFVLDPERERVRQSEITGQIEAAKAAGRSEAIAAVDADSSIAVLPFLNLSDDPANVWFSDGLAEELLNLLARNPQLRVISRSSSFAYRDSRLRATEIAGELRVRYLLEGSVRRVGDRLRITTQLIDAPSDSHVWSETYDRSLGDIFLIQEEIAAAVGRRLDVSLFGARPSATDPAAYAQYLQARYLAQLGTADGYRQALALLDPVVAEDQGYAPARDLTAGIYINLAAKGLMPADEGFAKAREAARRALEIDPQFAHAHARLGWVALLADNDIVAAARHYARALELGSTNVRIIGDASVVLKSLGRIDESIRLDEYVAARDPVNPSAFYNLGGDYQFARRYDDAIGAFDTALRLSPNRVGAWYQISIVHLLAGDGSQALDSASREPFDLLRQIASTMALDAVGRDDDAERTLDELIREHERDAAYNIAAVYAMRGDRDAAFDWLARAADYGDPGLNDIVADPLLDSLRADRRWLPFLESIGRAPAQLEAIAFDVRLPGAAESGS